MTDPEIKAELYRRLASIHRDRRDSLAEAIEALRNLRELAPGDDAARDELCDALIGVGAHLEAVPLLRQRIDGARAEDRVALLSTLAEVLDEHVGDDEGAFDAATRLLDEDHGNLDALARMEKIDAQAGRWDRLIETLSYRAEVTPPPERAGIFVRMAEIADREIGDLARAAEHYGKALELSPEPATLDALCDVYDRAERYRDLVLLLKEHAKTEQDPRGRAELYRRIARTLAARVRNEDAAAEAWQEVLVAGEDEEALRFLVAHARARVHLSELEDTLGRLAALVDSDAERRDLMLERARVLSDAMGEPRRAISVLRDFVERLDGTHVPALSQLAELCEEVSDLAGLSMSLERQLAITEDEGLRVPIAKRLADLYEGELDDRPRAIDALYAWADADSTEPEPQRRLVRLLEASKRWEDLIGSLDALAGIEQDDAVVSEVVRKAAALAVEHLGDVDGAWERLAGRVEDGDDECEVALQKLAKDVARGEGLADLYVRLAQSTDDARRQAGRWRDAAATLEEHVRDPARALEAMLRAFALDLDDSETLDQVDRLAVEAGAFPRLAQVYDTLLRRAADAKKPALLVRHARILETRADDASAALDNVLRACSLAPDDDEVLGLAEELAPKADRAEELFVVYDRRRQRAHDEAGRVEAFLRAAKLADGPLADRERAIAIIGQAVLQTANAPELLSTIEVAVRELDDLRPEVGPGAARRALIEVYRTLAERVAEDSPQTGGEMLRRAASLLVEDLGDDAQAFEYLVNATTLAPGREDILDELEQLAEKTDRFPDFASHLGQLVEDALDQATAAALLKRRGRIVEVELEQYSEAADVWAQLLAVSRTDPRCLRACACVCVARAGIRTSCSRSSARWSARATRCDKRS